LKGSFYVGFIVSCQGNQASSLMIKNFAQN
jgi:hypothetical protein